jgi:hypothetical protein
MDDGLIMTFIAPESDKQHTASCCVCTMQINEQNRSDMWAIASKSMHWIHPVAHYFDRSELETLGKRR